MAPGRKDGDRGVCLAEIQSKRQERKRRSTANPAYSGLLETEVRPPLQGGGLRLAPLIRPPGAQGPLREEAGDRRVS